MGGPFLALLHSPELAQRTAHLGSYVRFESSLDHKLIELAALATARGAGMQARMERARNPRAEGRHLIETIRAIHQKKGPEHFSSEDAQIISYVQELLRTHRASETTFQALYGRWEKKVRRIDRHRRLLRNGSVYLECVRPGDGNRG